MSLFGFVTNGH